MRNAFKAYRLLRMEEVRERPRCQQMRPEIIKSGSRHLGGYKVDTLRRGKLAAPSGTRCPPRASQR